MDDTVSAGAQWFYRSHAAFGSLGACHFHRGLSCGLAAGTWISIKSARTSSGLVVHVPGVHAALQPYRELAPDAAQHLVGSLHLYCRQPLSCISPDG